MTKTIKSTTGEWNFEIYNNNDDITTTDPTIVMLVESFPEGHNSKFPYKVLAAYYADNPYSFFNKQPIFNIEQNNKILLLKHNYNDIKIQLTNVLRFKKKNYNKIVYGKKKKEI